MDQQKVARQLAKRLFKEEQYRKIHVLGRKSFFGIVTILTLAVPLMSITAGRDIWHTFDTKYQDAGEPKYLVFTVGSISIVLAGLYIYLMFRDVAREIKSATPPNSLFQFMAIYCTFMGVICIWYSAGLFPTSYVFRDQTSNVENDSGNQNDVNQQIKATVTGKPDPKITEGMNPGIFGDQFGAVNSLFSGLAFAGVFLALLFQMIDLKYQRAELSDTKETYENNYQLQLIQTLLAHSAGEDALKANLTSQLKQAVLDLNLKGNLKESSVLSIMKFIIQNSIVGNINALGMHVRSRNKAMATGVANEIRQSLQEAERSFITGRRFSKAITDLDEILGYINSVSDESEWKAMVTLVARVRDEIVKVQLQLLAGDDVKWPS